MLFTFVQRIICSLTIPDGKSLKIDKFIFTPSFEGERQARYIQAIVDANTQEEAKIIARKAFNEFLAKLTLIDNSKYILEEQLSVSDESSTTVHTMAMSLSYSVANDGNLIKNKYEKAFKFKHPKKTPLRLYQEGIQLDNPFEKFKSFYRVLESYYTTKNITKWILKQNPKTEMKIDKHDNPVTIYTWIRIKLSHSKNSKKDLKPLLLSSLDDVRQVNRCLPKMKELAREIIREMEDV